MSLAADPRTPGVPKFAPGRRLHAVLRGRPRALRRRPAAVQARPDGAPDPHLDGAPRDRGPRRVRPPPAGRRRTSSTPSWTASRSTSPSSGATPSSGRRSRPRSCPSWPRPAAAACAPGAPAAPTAPRPTRSPPSAARRSRRRASRSRAPTSTTAWSPAPAQGAFSAEDARGAPRRSVDRFFPGRPGDRGAAPDGLVRARRPAAHAGAARGLRPRAVPQHGHLLHRGGPRRAPRAPRASPSSPAATSSSARPSASRTPAPSGSRPRSTSSTARAEQRWTSPSTCRCSWRRGASTSRSSTSPSSASRRQPDDRETVDEIFRIAHSLKGMSATMGFAGMAALTHEMEDVFELLRQRRDGLEPRRRDRAAALPRRALARPSTRSRPTGPSRSSPSR